MNVTLMEEYKNLCPKLNSLLIIFQVIIIAGILITFSIYYYIEMFELLINFYYRWNEIVDRSIDVLNSKYNPIPNTLYTD
jgi:hypothetical protein